MSQSEHDDSNEFRLVRDYQVTSFACRELANWALAHFGERTNPAAYQRIITSLGNSGADYAVEKVWRDLAKQGFDYRNEAIWRMFERFRLEGERRYPSTRYMAA